MPSYIKYGRISRFFHYFSGKKWQECTLVCFSMQKWQERTLQPFFFRSGFGEETSSFTYIFKNFFRRAPPPLVSHIFFLRASRSRKYIFRSDARWKDCISIVFGEEMTEAYVSILFEQKWHGRTLLYFLGKNGNSANLQMKFHKSTLRWFTLLPTHVNPTLAIHCRFVELGNCTYCFDFTWL